MTKNTITIKRTTVHARSVGRLREPMVIGNKENGDSICLHIASDIAEAKRLANDRDALQKAIDADHADAIARGYEDRRFILV